MLCGSENWTISAKDSRRITAAEMKFIRKIAGCSWTDHKKITEIAKEQNVTAVLDKIQEYRKNFL